MSRIIGGSAGGRRLRMPRGDRTRPTSDRVREALFSTLESTLGVVAGDASWEQVDVLDLYAGSGAVGLEAASRGARRVVLVERDRAAAAVIRDNAHALGLQASVRCAAVGKTLGSRSSAEGTFDVVFLDPPYDLAPGLVSEDLESLARQGWLASRAVVVVERAARAEVTWPAGFEVDRVRRYGETALHHARWAGSSESALSP